jgi:hypothetical protein
MAGSGIDAQVMVGEEATWGTAVAVSRGYPFNSESIRNDLPTIESDAIRAGQRLQNEADYVRGVQRIDGDLEIELRTKGMAFLHKHMLGSISTAGAGPYTHTVTPGDLTGRGLTVQVGRPGSAGVVHPFTYSGVKVASWELSCGVDEIASLSLTLAGKAETTATALVAASYAASSDILAFTHGALTIGGNAAKVRNVTVTGDNGLNLERYFFGSTARDEPLEGASRRSISGTLEAEFVDLSQYSAFVAGTNAAMVLSFTRGAASVTYTMNVRFDGETPTVDSTDILGISIPFKCVSTSAMTDASAFTAVIVSSEATP